GLYETYKLNQKFPAVCEIIRQEERVKPLIPKEQNPGKIPTFYYSLHSFEAKGDNDYLMVDTLLSKMTQPCAVEMLVSPVDQSKDLEAQYKYITRLMSVNQYGDDSLSDIESADAFGEGVAEQRVALKLERKRDPMADDIAREHQEFHRNLRKPQLLFHVKAFAMNQENALMLASAVAESGFANGKYRLLSYGMDGSKQSTPWLDTSVKDSQKMTVSLDAMHPAIWDDDVLSGYRKMARLCRMATVDELKGIIRLPVGGHSSPRCIRKSTDPEAKKGEASILIGDDMESSEPAERKYDQELNNLPSLFTCKNPTRLESRLPLKGLTKHMFVAGVPGSGKTTAVYNMLIQLFQHGKPFLVIEPAKTEYRILKTLQNHPDRSIQKLARQIRIYSPGNDNVSPFRFNPLAHPDGITLDEHISQVLACFEAAMPMGGPLQALIAEAVEEVYQGYSDGLFPQMTDLLAAAQRIMERKKYVGEIQSNLQAAIEVRLGLLIRRAMGRIFQCRNSIPDIAELLEYPTIIEMDYLSQDHACLLTLFLLASIREHIKIDPKRKSKGLHHVTVIEEAHNIVGRTGSARASEDIADPKAFAAQYVSRMLAELRALGEGIIIADQLPSTVASEVVKNTGTKLAHRLVSNEDREDLGGAMLLGKAETEEIARLPVGEAYFYTEGLHRPRRVHCLNANIYLKLGDFPETNEIVASIQKEDWFIDGCVKRTRILRIVFDAAIREAKDLARDEKKNLVEFSERCEELLKNEPNGEDSNYNLKLQKLKAQCESHRSSIDRLLNIGNQHLSIIESSSQGNNEKINEAIELSIEYWKENIIPHLSELVEEFALLELRIPQA
ncbi:MAG: ATP-binding protein, partial [Chloroflexi bacterium]|nr:ATP-binding protein [Chloroflexota bacterium]